MLKYLLKTQNPSTANANEVVDVDVMETVMETVLKSEMIN